jgi:hypothetical protein
MEEQNKNAVAVPGSQGGAVGQVGAVRLGFEEPTDQRDLIIPIVKMFQGNPTEADQYPDAKGGQLLNSLTQEVLASDFIPCFKWTEYSKFNGRNAEDPEYREELGEPGALVWRTTTPTAEQAAECEFGPNGEKPKANRSLCFFVYVIGQQMPLVLRFSKTSFTAGKKLLSLAQFSGGNMFDRKYKLTTKKEQKDKNIYYVMQIALVGKATDEEKAVAQQWYNDFKGKSLKVHEENETPAPAADAKDVGFEE